MKKTDVAHWILTVAALGVGTVSLYLLVTSRRSEPRGELTLHDEKGRVRVRLNASNDGASLELLDDQSRVRIGLRQDQTGSTIRLTRAGEGKAVELVVLDGANGPASQATLSLYSKAGTEASTLGASDQAWMKLRSGAGEVFISQDAQRSEIEAVYLENVASFQVDKDQSRFTTHKPVTIDLAGASSVLQPRP